MHWHGERRVWRANEGRGNEVSLYLPKFGCCYNVHNCIAVRRWTHLRHVASVYERVYDDAVCVNAAV